jgi:hypothetical protein
LAKFSSSHSALLSERDKGALRTFFRSPRQRLFVLVQAGVEIETLFFFNMKADKSRVGDNRPFIIDIGEFAFRRVGRDAAFPKAAWPL